MLTDIIEINYILGYELTPFMTHSGLSLRFQVSGLIIKYRMKGIKQLRSQGKSPAPNTQPLLTGPAYRVKPLYSRSLKNHL